MVTTFVKDVHDPAAYVAWEAAGLRWLADAGGAAVAEVVATRPSRLILKRIHAVPPSSAHAERFGRGLAIVHAAGASAYGVGPDGWDRDGWLGPSNDLLPLPIGAFDTWGEMYADARLIPTAHHAVKRGQLGEDDVLLVERVADRLRAGEFDTEESPARVHGDLWSGNVMWSPEGAVLIDPAAHGGHRETDLAMLALFGAPHLDRIIAAYSEQAPLADGWRDRVALMQLHPLLVHAALYGGSYCSQAREIAARYAS